MTVDGVIDATEDEDSTAREGQRRRSTMEPRLNVITLAVDDLERALVFYRDAAPIAPIKSGNALSSSRAQYGQVWVPCP